MTNEQIEHERRYRITILVAAAILKQSLPTEDEYRIINDRMIEKFKPLLGGLIRLHCRDVQTRLKIAAIGK